MHDCFCEIEPISQKKAELSDREDRTMFFPVYLGLCPVFTGF